MEQRVRGSTTFERLVQAGLVGYGSLHLLTAWISVSILIGQQPATTSRRALADLAQTGTGLVLLLVLAVGFVVLAVWHGIAGVDGYRHIEGRRRHVMRFGALCRSLTYGYLAFAMGRLLLERRATSSPRSTSASILSEPIGRFVLGTAGLVIIGVGQIVFGVRRQFVNQLDDEARDKSGRRSCGVRHYGTPRRPRALLGRSQ